MSSTQQNAAPFALFAAFTSSPFGGNPAAVVFLDPVKTPLNVLQGLAKNFNQPMVAFVRPPTEESFTDNRVRTTVRYMSHSGDDIALCGHASICAAAAILALPEFQNLSDIKVKLVEFETFLGNRTVPVRVLENGQFELGLPLAPPIKPSADERQRIETFVQHAFRNSGREIKIVDVMVGPQGFEHALLVEIDVEAELAAADVDVTVFARSGYTQNVITSLPSLSSTIDESGEYIYRMFSSHIPGGEDPVCGSAQCLLTPYWHARKQLEKGREIKTVAVSPRRGVVQIVWEQDITGGKEDAVLLKGTTAFLGKGECYF